jgi:glycosyltransferase involved in cell wall biosynthesis
VEVTAKKRALAAADKIICISESTASDLQAIYGVERNKIQVIHLAPSLMFQPSDDSPPAPEHPYLLYVGARTLYKNFDTLLAAFERWQPQVPVDLVVVGGPWEESEIGRLSGHKRRHQIHLLTHVDDERLASLYRQALAFVYPSLYEGFGIPLLEAMACRCPIVASRIPSNEEIAGDYPVYFDPTSIDDLVSALDASAAIGRHPELEARGSIILARYSWEKTAAQTLVQYYRVTDKPIPSNLRQTLDTLGARRTETVKSGASNHA